jgi:hypothetical protein
MAMGEAGLPILPYTLLLAVLLQSCHGQERKVNFCSLNVQSHSTWDDSLENNLCYVHAGSHCIHGRAASRKYFCFIYQRTILKENIIKWKIKIYSGNNKMMNTMNFIWFSLWSTFIGIRIKSKGLHFTLIFLDEFTI